MPRYQYTLDELRQKFRASDPNNFSGYNDEELIKYIFSEFPSYKRHVVPEELPEQYPTYTMVEEERYEPSIVDHIKHMHFKGTAIAGSIANSVDHWLNEAYQISETYSPTAIALDKLMESMTVTKAAEVSPERAAQVKEDIEKFGTPWQKGVNKRHDEREAITEKDRLGYMNI